MEIKAVHRKYTGFSDIQYYENDCTILDFISINGVAHAVIQVGNSLSTAKLSELYIQKGE